MPVFDLLAADALLDAPITEFDEASVCTDTGKGIGPGNKSKTLIHSQDRTD
jgi:hypothetical protein